MSALKEFANFISLNVANLAATYDRLRAENSESYAVLPTDKRMARARRLIKTVAEVCQSGTADLLYHLFDDRTSSLANQPSKNQPSFLLAEVECLGQTLTPVVTNLEAGKFLWQILSEARATIFRLAESPVLANEPELTVTAQGISVGQQFQEDATTEHNLLRTLLERRAYHMQISSEIAQQLSSTLSLADLYQRVVNLMQERLGYYHVQIYTLAEEGMVLQEGAGEIGRQLKEAGHTIALNTEKSLVVRAVWSGESVLVTDVSQEPTWLPNSLLPATQAELAVPISLGAEVIGVLDVQSDRVGGLGREDQLLLEGLARQIAIAIDNRRAYLAEKEARRQYQQILDGIVDMVLVKGPKSRIIWANKAFRDYYNMTNEQLQELIDAPFNEPDYTQQYVKDDEYVFTTGETLDIPQEPVTRFDGEVRLFHTVKSALRDAEGKVVMTVGVSRDITGQRQIEAERERLLAETERRARREQTIRTITERMRSANNLEQLVKITARELGQQLSAGHAIVELGFEKKPAIDPSGYARDN